MTRRGLLSCLMFSAVLLGSVRAIRAVSVKSWLLSTAEEFGQGKLEGTAIDDEGRVRLSRGLASSWGPEPGIVWSVRAAASGEAVFVALSAPGRLIRVAPDGQTETWYEAEGESMVTAVASGADGALYVGVSPEGRVLGLSGPRQVARTVETGAKFVWALEVGGDGALWIGTGVPGALQRYREGGAVETVFATGDDPVRCLRPAEGAGAWIGTGGRGRVIRVDGARRALALLDAEESEIVALESGPDGSIYALAASGTKQVARDVPSPVATTVETVRVVAEAPPGQPGSEAADASTEEVPEVSKQSFQTSPGAALYRIAPDGAAHRIWQDAQDVPYALLREADGHLLVATGDKGRIRVLDPAGRVVMILQIASEQASALTGAPDGTAWVGGTSDARLVHLDATPREAGRYLAPPVDAASGADWGRVVWNGEVPRGAALHLLARAGNTDVPDETWHDWKPLGRGEPGGTPLGLPPSRFVQLRIDMKPSPAGESPLLRSLELFYRPRNRAPRIEALTVEPAGVVWSRANVASGRASGPLVASDPLAREVSGSLGPRMIQPIRTLFERGARTVSWKAVDPDGDTLVCRLEIRREGEDAWFPLAHGIEDEYFGWDSRDLADGLYRVRLVADDAPDNPTDRQLAAERVSAVFAIDHTRPSLGAPRFSRGDDAFEVEFDADDAGGAIRTVEVALDDEDWRPVDPVDGVADAPRERYRVRLGPVGREAAGPRSLRVRVADTAGNLGGETWLVERR